MKQTATARAKANPKKAAIKKTATETSPAGSSKKSTSRARAQNVAQGLQLQVPLTNGTGTDRKKRKASPLKTKSKKSPVASTSQQMEDMDISEDEAQDEMKPQTSASSPKAKRAQKRPAAKAASSEVPVKKAVSAQKVKIVPRSLGIPPRMRKLKSHLKVPIFPLITGNLFVFGENDCGQLGLDPEEIDQQKTPFLLHFPFRFADVAAGGMHSVVLNDLGEVWTFGCNDEGALGRLTEKENSEYIAERVDIPGVAVKITAGDSHSACLTEDGKAYVWGNFRGTDGPMGLTAPGVRSFSPVRILSDHKIVNIASGVDHLVCLTNEGKVFTCGCGELGQLGRVTERSCTGEGRRGKEAENAEKLNVSAESLLQLEPVAIKLNIGNIWAGGYSTFFKSRGSGKIYACGLNNYNQLGFPGGENAEKCFHPKKVDSLASNLQWKQISIGQHHMLALDKDGKVYSVGNKNFGRLGLGEDCDFPTTPTLIPTLQDEECVAISAGNTSSFSISKTGKAYSWGMGNGFLLGHGNDRDYHVPTAIQSLLDEWNVIKISGGGQHTLIVACNKDETETT